MKPKYKAEDLILKYSILNDGHNHLVKECAIIAVDEIIYAIDWHEFEAPNKEIEYWQQVKTEIEKL